MSSEMQIREAYNLLAADCPDEEIERLTGVSLLEILVLRAGQASASWESFFSAELADTQCNRAQASQDLGVEWRSRRHNR